MEYPLYNEHGIRIGMLTTSNPIPRNATIKISDNQEYFAITNTTEERLNELVEKNSEVLREGVENKAKDHYCMGCEKMVEIKYARQGSETWDIECAECGGDELTEMKGE